MLTFWQLYSQDEIVEIDAVSTLYEMQGLPKVVIEDDTEQIMDQFMELIMEFKRHVLLAVKPVRCICCRTSCFCCFRGIFGTLDQLRFMLEKNFDG